MILVDHKHLYMPCMPMQHAHACPRTSTQIRACPYTLKVALACPHIYVLPCKPCMLMLHAGPRTPVHSQACLCMILVAPTHLYMPCMPTHACARLCMILVAQTHLYMPCMPMHSRASTCTSAHVPA